MKNDIIRKLTSLTLMTIMVAGGLTFAIPSALPQAAAAPGTDGTLTVSSTEFGGQQIIEIKVNDPDFRSVDTNVELGQPDVKIDGNNVQMVQASTGIWYAYVADNRAAGNTGDDADLNNPLLPGTTTERPIAGYTTAPESGADSISQGALLQNPPRPGGGSNDGAGVDDDYWPYVQLYNFNGITTDTFDVVYNDEDRVTLTYDDDLTDSVTFSLDRANVPQGGVVHIIISDTRLNLDPTGADTWALDTNHDDAVGGADYLPNARYGTDFNHVDGVDTLTTAPPVDLGADHGSLALAGELNIKAGSVVNDADAELDESSTIMVGETGRNTNEFVSAINNISPINLDDEADINSRVTSSYAGEEATLTVRDESTDISITSDDFWNSGEPATVTVTAPNLDLNTKTDNDVTIGSDLIPTIVIGSPITIDKFDIYKAGFIAHDDTDATHYTLDNTDKTVDNAFDDNDVTDAVTERYSVNGLVTTNVTQVDVTGTDCTVDIDTQDTTRAVTCTADADGNTDTGDLTDTNGDGKIGTGDEARIVDTVVHGETKGESRLLEITEPISHDTLTFTIENADVSAPFFYIHIDSSLAGTFSLENTTLADPDTFAPITEGGVVETLPTNMTLTLTSADTTIEKGTIVFDILSFGAITDDDGDITSVENNAIYRHLLEETDEGGVFEGTLEYTMLNQVNIGQADTYGGIDTQSNELVMVIDDEYTGNDLQISYAGETAHVEVLTSGGTVSLDADSYSTNGSVSVTLVDQDLNVDNDEEESYTLNQNGTVRGEDTAKLLVFEIDDKVWESCDEDSELGLPADFTLEESADAPGTFTASFDIPTTYCDGSDEGTGAVTGKSLQVTYEDFRDDTGISTTWSDSATIQAVTGTVSIDRNVYPVPADDKNVVVHIEINDPDFNADSDVLDKIPVGQVAVEITAVSSPTPENISADVFGDATHLEETTEDSGIFSETIEIPSNVLGDKGPIEQSYILSVTYTDNSDATGEESDVTDSAIFNIGTATLDTDATEYTIKQKAFVTLVDHDNNYDSDTRETISLTAIEWEGSADADLGNSEFDASPPFLRETEANSGIFLTEITIPEFVDDNGDEEVERGESVTLTYTDNSPAGADRPGLDDRSVETGFTISRTGASLTLDKDVYSWRDRVTITVVAPDFNIDPLAVESVGNDGEVQIRSQIGDAETTLTETGPNTGIFQGTEDLGGFEYEVADGVTVQPATMLKVGSEDGISVTFTYDEDERDLIQSALIRWSVAEVAWLEDSYREGATGTLQVIDPDRNLHPDTPDSIETIVFSDTYRGGIRVALTETEPASGIFEGEVIFDVLHSEGNRLQVSEGDIVTAAYDDATLPPPDDGDDLRVTGTTTVGSIVPPLERVAVSNLGVVDALGSAVDSVSVGQQVNIAADLASAQSRSQDYAYLLQIQNMDGVTVHLSWAASSLAGFGGANVSQSWTPDEAGSYTATVFVWESLTNPTALSPQNSIDITVV